MQEIRCVKCHKVIGKSPTYKGHLIGSVINYSQSPHIKFVLLSVGADKVIEIQCPHNYRDKNGKNVQCKTLNLVVI